LLQLPTFARLFIWLKSKGKLGGQNKVPRLSNNREYIEEVLGMMGAGRKINLLNYKTYQE
jgi:hypothetical protein